MSKNSNVSMYGPVGMFGFTALTAIFAVLVLMRPDVGPTVIVIWCLLLLLFKLDILTLEIMKLNTPKN